jgi:hypothetical protein
VLLMIRTWSPGRISHVLGSLPELSTASRVVVGSNSHVRRASVFVAAEAGRHDYKS